MDEARKLRSLARRIGMGIVAVQENEDADVIIRILRGELTYEGDNIVPEHTFDTDACATRECDCDQVTEAQVRAAWDALGPRRTVHLKYEELRTALEAAMKVER